MNRMPIKILCLPVLLMLAACTGKEKAMPEAPAQAHVTGSATYRERMMLPPQAELTATLEDVSLADAPSVTLGEVRMQTDHAPPYAFKIPYDPARIQPQNVYAVRVRIMLDGKLLMISDTHTPVLTRGSPDSAELVLKMVSASQP
ncbi:MAG: YbaY family lipoprotein [Arenimonas sp.]